MRRFLVVSFLAAGLGCGACEDAPPPAPPAAPAVREPAQPTASAPSIGLETQPPFRGQAGERRDLSSRGVPMVMLVPGGAEVLDADFTLPGASEATPSLVISKAPLRLELVKAAELKLERWKSALAGARVEREEVADDQWSLIWSEEERLGIATWRAGVLCVSRDLQKAQLKDALKLCQSMAPSPDDAKAHEPAP